MYLFNNDLTNKLVPEHGVDFVGELAAVYKVVQNVLVHLADRVVRVVRPIVETRYQFHKIVKLLQMPFNSTSLKKRQILNNLKL
jgi:hypothetical protein